ncbi:sigma factor [Xanthomonas cerealis]|uniref:sigma factor n=2 Tax=Xanthomonas cerealis TaxID=3390025 RepID=UPI001F266A4E|nr:sigma factor [Xanthomonas translucens]
MIEVTAGSTAGGGGNPAILGQSDRLARCHAGARCPVLVAMRPDPAFASQRRRLFGLAYRLLGSRSDAEELLQDAWLRLAVARPGPASADRHGQRRPSMLGLIGARLHSAVRVVIDGERIVEALTLMNPDKRNWCSCASPSSTVVPAASTCTPRLEPARH